MSLHAVVELEGPVITGVFGPFPNHQLAEEWRQVVSESPDGSAYQVVKMTPQPLFAAAQLQALLVASGLPGSEKVWCAAFGEEGISVGVVQGEAVEEVIPTEYLGHPVKKMYSREERVFVAPAVKSSDPGAVALARDFAIKAHGDQKYGGQPYIVHLDAVANILRPNGSFARIVGYLHDVLEDTKVTYEELADAFGSVVADLVLILTDEGLDTRRERKAKSNAKLRAVKADRQLALIVKAADRLANMRESAKGGAGSKLEMYRREHPEFTQAAFRPGLCDELWAEMDAILKQPI